MLKAGIAFSPIDAHPSIKKISTKVFPIQGGNGFVRSALEYLLDIKKIDLNKLEKLINLR